MNDWYQRMVAVLQLNGKGERTQQAYTRSVRISRSSTAKPGLGFGTRTPRVIDEKKTKLAQTLSLEIHYAPIDTSNLTFTSFGANHRSTTIPLIWIAAAQVTGFLNTGLRRLPKSSQSLLVRPPQAGATSVAHSPTHSPDRLRSGER